MTSDILQSDIDLVRKLLAAGRPTNEIVEALGYRSVHPDRAARLIADLQSGKPVEPDKPIKINLGSTPPLQTSRPENQPGQPRQLPSKRTRSRPQSQDQPNSHWFTIIGLTAAAVCVVAFVFLNRRTHSAATIDPRRGQAAANPASTPVADTQPEAASRLEPKGISIEVERNGLRLCGNPVARENFSASIFKILGAPSRTNEVQKVDQIVYAYDTFGMLVYSAKNSGTHSIVLDFDGSEGAGGTKSAFVGTLKVNDQIVHARTDAISLAQIKELAVQTPSSASGIYRAQYGDLELVFGYLKTPERLSLVEIDFK